MAPFLARHEAEYGDSASALDHLSLVIRNFQDAGDNTSIRVPLAVLAVLFDRLGHHEPAATIAGFALSPIAATGVPEITTAITHLRDVLGEEAGSNLVDLVVGIRCHRGGAQRLTRVGERFVGRTDAPESS